MDYYRHFGLRTNPFDIVGQPTSLYMSKAHREGLAALEWGLLHEPGSFTLLIGEVGTGKTTLINALHGRNYDYARIAYVTNPKLSFEEMLRTILEELGYLPMASTKLELLKKFEWFFGQLRANERIGIIIDEAQALSDDTLEELRLFSNYGTNGKGHLEIMLVGQPELLNRLMSPSLRQFHQRIGARAVLNPLQRDEALEYVDFKLRQSGGRSLSLVRGTRPYRIGGAVRSGRGRPWHRAIGSLEEQIGRGSKYKRIWRSFRHRRKSHRAGRGRECPAISKWRSTE